MLIAPRGNRLRAILVVLTLFAAAGAVAWTRQAQTDPLAPAPKPSLLAAGLSQAALDRQLQGLDPDARALASRLDPARHADLAGRPLGWAVFDLARIPALGVHDPSFTDARRINALIPAAAITSPPARPFVLRASAADRAQAEQCLAQTVYFEAGRESPEGQAAVAQTVLNRLRHPDYPKSVCGVVYQGSGLSTGCQFSFTCDGSLNQPLMASVWNQARAVARRALNGYVMPAVGEATHYHADYVHPYWSPTLVKITQIGAHIFYRWTGPGGEPDAFIGRYAGHEAHLSPAVLRQGDDRVVRPGAPQPASGVVSHVRTFTVADAGQPGGVRTRVSAVIAASPPGPVGPTTAAATPAIAITPPLAVPPATATAPSAQDHASDAVAAR